MQLILEPNTERSQGLRFSGKAATIGSAKENVIVLPGAAAYHVRIFHLDGAFFAQDLSGQGFLCDGEKVSRCQLSTGSLLKLGEGTILVIDESLDTAEEPKPAMAPEAEVVTEAEVIGAIPAGIEAREINIGTAMTISQGTAPMAGIQANEPPEFRGEEERIDTAARLALIFGCCGPLLLLCGQLVGFILAIVALSKRGLTRASRHAAWTGLTVSLVWWMLMGSVAGAFLWRDMNKNRIARNEAAIARLMQNIVTAQVYVRNAILVDVNGDLDGEYATFEELEKIPYREATLQELNQQPLRKGYLLQVQRADENGFELCATPETYGITGNKTFWIDQAGFLCAFDMKGQPMTKGTIPLEASRAESSIMQTMETELSDDLARAAEEAFNRNEYEKCQKIIDNIQKVFPNSKVKERLTALEKATDPFMIETQSRKLNEDAKKFCELNQVDAAIEKLRQLMQHYPSSTLAAPAKEKIIELTNGATKSLVEQAERFRDQHNWGEMNNSLNQIGAKYPEAMAVYQARINQCREKANAMREEDAAALLKKAQEAEIAQRSEEAYNIYLKIKNEYGGTKASSGIDEALSKTGSQINEQRAQAQVKEILATGSVGNEKAVVQMIDLLERGYAQTKEYEKVKDVMVKLKKECNARLFTSEARELFRVKSYRAALNKLEMAIQEDPSVKLNMSEQLEECYAALGDAAYENQDMNLALNYYQKYLAMRPQQPVIDRLRLMECYFFKAKDLYGAKSYAEARNYFERCMEAYGSNPEFNFMYGFILYQAGEWENSLRFFSSSQQGSSTFANDARKYWTFALYNLALGEDEQLRKMALESGAIAEMLNSYALSFDTKPRTEGSQKVKLADVVKKNASETFDSVLKSSIDALDALAIKARKYVIIPKEQRESRIDSSYSIETTIKELKAQLKKLYAYSSAERESNLKILAEIKKLVKQYSDLTAALATLKQKSPSPSVIEGHQQLTEKLALLKQAQESFEKFVMAGEQRQQYVLSQLNSMLDNVSVNNINHTVIKTETDKLRELHSNRKDQDDGLKALRCLTDMYSIVPNLTTLGLGDIMSESEAK